MTGLVAWRAGLLEDRRIVAVGMAESTRERLVGLGAEVLALEEGNEEGARAVAPVHSVIVDVRSQFAAAGLLAAGDAAWEAVRSVVVSAMIGHERVGKVVLVAPGPDAGEHAGALRASLENLARTLSTEWARYGITTAAILPGPASSEAEIAELITLLVSPAGEYFSGCRLELR